MQHHRVLYDSHVAQPQQARVLAAGSLLWNNPRRFVTSYRRIASRLAPLPRVLSSLQAVVRDNCNGKSRIPQAMVPLARSNGQTDADAGTLAGCESGRERAEPCKAPTWSGHWLVRRGPSSLSPPYLSGPPCMPGCLPVNGCAG
jgi:hypothetical protein